MKLYNSKTKEQVSFVQAVKDGLGKERGLYCPSYIPILTNIDELLEMPFVMRSQKIMRSWLEEELGGAKVDELVRKAFSFMPQLVRATPRMFALELYHGPSLAFKDFGARFMAQCLALFAGKDKITILTATSGDTGAAVADAFYGLNNIRVVILYPKNKISPLQEKLFCTLGKNIHTLAVDGDFDACQNLVKTAFQDEELKKKLKLNSANSINISRLMAQVCYYFEGVARFREFYGKKVQPVVSVPCGNFGNLTAGFYAKAMSLPIKRFVAATNANDTVPRYLKTNMWEPHKTVATMTNAMDVSEPSNWERIMEHFKKMQVHAIGNNWQMNEANIQGISITEEQTVAAMKALHKQGYVAEPHTALASCGLSKCLKADEAGIFLSTAHPAKFKEKIEEVLGIQIFLPEKLLKASEKKLLSEDMPADFDALRKYLLS
ncbi:MAG: threonine synthase [Candidatus Riflebacteria bacterium]|nr:threonine synthase [Candidatus Riflebacteria bacterium]